MRPYSAVCRQLGLSSSLVTPYLTGDGKNVSSSAGTGRVMYLHDSSISDTSEESKNMLADTTSIVSATKLDVFTGYSTMVSKLDSGRGSPPSAVVIPEQEKSSLAGKVNLLPAWVIQDTTFKSL